MTISRYLILLAMCVLPGCSMYHAAIEGIVIEPLQYCLHTEYHFSAYRDHRAANRAWEQAVVDCPEANYSGDYELGFKSGFCDYLLKGGSGIPPAVPPRRYWRAKYQTPEGHRAVEEWFAGFRHGAAMAQASGLREVVTIPSSIPVPVSSDWRHPEYGTGFEQSGESVPAALPADIELLPGPGVPAAGAGRASPSVSTAELSAAAAEKLQLPSPDLSDRERERAMRRMFVRP